MTLRWLFRAADRVRSRLLGRRLFIAAPRPCGGCIVATGEALEEEFEAIHELGWCEEHAATLAAERSALCLSGGGIRSGAFCLGVLQGLADRGMLARFHYLSTVSGGGFIGGWLSMMVQRLGAAEAERRLAASCADVGRRTPPELRALREFTNYLTPRGGVFSSDTWTAIVPLGRNLVLNWLVFLPWFLALVLVAAAYRDILWLAGESMLVGHWLAVVASAALLLGTASRCLGLPSHRRWEAAGRWDYLTKLQVVWTVVVPALAWAALLPMTFSRHWLPPDMNGPEWALPLLYVCVTLAGYVYAAAVDRRRNPGRMHRSPFLTNLPSWLVASSAAACFLWLGLYLGRAHVGQVRQAEALAVAGPLWFVLVSILHSAVHVGLRPETDRADLDREWLARVSAYKLRPALLWAAFSACCLVLPRHLEWASLKAAYAALAAGPVGAWLGKQVMAQAQGGAGETGFLDRAFAVVPPVLCLVFAAALFAVLGDAVEFGLLLAAGPAPAHAVVPRLPTFVVVLSAEVAALGLDAQAAQLAALLDRAANPRCAACAAVDPERLLHLLSALAVASAAGFLLGRRINVNRFSLHGV